MNTWRSGAVPLASVRGTFAKRKLATVLQATGQLRASILKETELMNRIKLALIAGGALFAAPALADDQTEPAAGGTVEAGAEAEVNAGGASAGMEGTVAATGDAAVSLTWSRSVIDRPYVMNAGKLGAFAQYAIAKASFDDGMGGSISATGDGFGVGAGYGINDKLTAGLTYGFTPGLIGDADSEIKGDLDIFGEFQIAHDGKLDITASADFELGLAADPVSKAIHAGLGARYNLAPKMAVFTGAPYGPGPVGQHLSISLDTDGPITFGVPVGFMFQATPELNLHVMTELTRIAISNAGDTIFFGADYIPLSVGGLYSVTPNIDLTALFALPDVKEIGFDLYAFAFGVKYNQ